MQPSAAPHSHDSRLANLPGWHFSAAGDAISKRFSFKNFVLALEFVNKLGATAEQENHHPDIALGWGYAEITFTTHDKGGLSESDFKLAELTEKLANA